MTFAFVLVIYIIWWHAPVFRQEYLGHIHVSSCEHETRSDGVHVSARHSVFN